jgi:hypothetical protein
LNDIDIALSEAAETSANILRLPLAEHQKEKRRHKNVVGPPVDQNDVVIRPELTP